MQNKYRTVEWESEKRPTRGVDLYCNEKFIYQLMTEISPDTSIPITIQGRSPEEGFSDIITSDRENLNSNLKTLIEQEKQKHSKEKK